MVPLRLRLERIGIKSRGVVLEVEIVQPETQLENRVLGYLMSAALREAKHNERIPYKLPDDLATLNVGVMLFKVNFQQSIPEALYDKIADKVMARPPPGATPTPTTRPPAGQPRRT